MISYVSSFFDNQGRNKTGICGAVDYCRFFELFERLITMYFILTTSSELKKIHHQHCVCYKWPIKQSLFQILVGAEPSLPIIITPGIN
jgi:hypothetical protein